MLLRANKTYISQTQRHFYCDFKIKIPSCFKSEVLDESFELLHYIDKTYNTYQSGSYLSEINSNAGEWTPADEIVIDILETIKLVSQITEGAYDITANPLIRLWGFYKNDSEKIPNNEEINHTRQKVNYQNIEIQDKKVRIGKDQEIISGSFIKAFTADMLISKLKDNHINEALINAGGSTIISFSDHNLPWKVNIPHPFKIKEKAGSIELINSSFSLSARSENYKIIEGKRYSHILNAITGHPTENIQCGVLCKSAFISDILSTALCAADELSFEKIIEKLKYYFEFDAFLITSDGRIKTTDNNLFNLSI